MNLNAPGTNAVCSLPPQLGTINTVCSQRREGAIGPSRWPPCVEVEGLLGGEVHCLKTVSSHPEVVSSPLAIRDAWLKHRDAPTILLRPSGLRPGILSGEGGAEGAPGRSSLPDSQACLVPIPLLGRTASPRNWGRDSAGGRAGRGGPRGSRGWGEPLARHRPPPAANEGGGAAPGLEPARDWPARGPGRGAGEASAVSAVIREGKVPCAESRADARSYGGRSGRAGPAGRAAKEDPRSRPRLSWCLSQASATFRGPEGLCTAAMGGVGEPGGGPGPREGPAPLGAPLPTFRWEQIRQHDLPGDKWLVIERRVYDISRWAQRHPGGSRLIGHHGAEDATVRSPQLLGWSLVVGREMWVMGSTCGP